MVRTARVSTIFCSFLPCTSTSKLFRELVMLLRSFRLSLYPNFPTTFSKAANFSSSGSSCIRYTNVCLGDFLPMNSDTLRLANNINSSMSLLASFDVLKNTPVGFASLSRSNLTSTLSKEIAPSFIRCPRIILASLSNSKVASTKASSTVYVLPVNETSAGISLLLDSIIACASS